MITLPHIRLASVVALMIIGCALLLAVTATSVHFLTLQSRTAAAFLPASSVSTFISQPTTDDKAWLEAHYAVTVPLWPASVTSVATLSTATNHTGVTIFTTDVVDANALPDSSWTVDYRAPYYIVTNQADQLLEAGDPQSLENAAAYQQLWQPPETNWRFMRSDQVTRGSHLIQNLATTWLLPGSTHLAFYTTSGHTLIRAAGSYAGSTNTLPQTVPALLPNPQSVLSVAAPQQSWQHTISHLPADNVSILNALVSASLANFVSTQLSWQHEVLPLLHKPVTLAVGSDSGKTIFAVHTFHKNNELDPLLQSMHDTLMHGAANTLVTERTLSDAFTSRDLRLGDTEAISQTLSVGQWSGTRTTAGDKEIFLLQNGDEVVISNTEKILDMLNKKVVHKFVTQPQLVPQAHIAGGKLPHSMLVTSDDSAMFLPPAVTEQSKSHVHWSLFNSATVKTLVLKME